ncbi:MAG: GGDEF domain-containing protein [Bacillota bacterium]|nr:GGDEF domain-containing protein [Bacillota bacterium]
MEYKFKLYLIIIGLLCLIFYQLFLYLDIRYRLYCIKKIRKCVNSISEGMYKAGRAEEVYMLLLNKVMNLIPNADRGSILIKNEQGGWRIGALKGYSKESFEVKQKNGDIVFHNKSTNNKKIIKKCQLANRVYISECYFPLLSTLIRSNKSSIISIPIYINAKLLGVLSVESKETVTAFSNRDSIVINYLVQELEQVLIHFFIQDSFKSMATYDELTGLYNRRKLRQLLSIELCNNKKEKMNTYIVLLDLDNFKSINDKHGHKAGDAALKYFADAMRKIITGENIYGRLSGDEFIIVFKNCTEEQVKILLHNLRDKLRQGKFKYGNIGFSYGAYCIPKDENVSVDEIICRADKNMYYDKLRKRRKSKQCNAIDAEIETININ